MNHTSKQEMQASPVSHSKARRSLISVPTIFNPAGRVRKVIHMREEERESQKRSTVYNTLCAYFSLYATS